MYTIHELLQPTVKKYEEYTTIFYILDHAQEPCECTLSETSSISMTAIIIHFTFQLALFSHDVFNTYAQQIPMIILNLVDIQQWPAAHLHGCVPVARGRGQR